MTEQIMMEATLKFANGDVHVVEIVQRPNGPQERILWTIDTGDEVLFQLDERAWSARKRAVYKQVRR